MPKFSDDQIRSWSEYEEGQEAGFDSSKTSMDCPYDRRTHRARAWLMGFGDATEQEADGTPVTTQDDGLPSIVAKHLAASPLKDRYREDDALKAIQGDVREANPDPDQPQPQPQAEPVVQPPAPTLQDYSAAELQAELERRGVADRQVPQYEGDALQVEIDRNHEITKRLTDPTCLLHPQSLVRRQGSHWYCSAGHPFETPGREDQDIPAPDVECPEHPGWLLDRIAMQGESTLYFCGQGQHHIRLDNDLTQLSLGNPVKKNF